MSMVIIWSPAIIQRNLRSTALVNRLPCSQMDKKQKKGGTTMNPSMVQGTTLRDEKIGKKRVDVSSMLRTEHLQNLATWASVEARIPPLGALFGYRLAATVEAEGVPLDQSTFACQRCESILQPGFNCTIRIEKIATKAKPCKNSRISSQNNVAYRCHFCSHPNLMRGTQRGYVKDVSASRQKLGTNPTVKCASITKMNKPDMVGADPNVQCSSATIMSRTGTVLEENKKHGWNVENEFSLDKCTQTPLLERLKNSSKRKRKKTGSHSVSGCVTLNSVERTGGGVSTKRKRKGWSSLKEITESNEARGSQSIGNLAIPFLLQPGK